MAHINYDIAVHNSMRRELETKHTGKWVLLYGRKLVSIFDSFEETAEGAVRRFGRGPYRIRGFVTVFDDSTSTGGVTISPK
jgi:hypothetical protein